MRALTIILGAGAIALLVWLLLPTEEDRIMRRLEHLAGVMNEGFADSSSGRNEYGAHVASFFSMNASIRFEEQVREIHGRNAVARFVSRFRGPDNLRDVTVLDMSFNFDRRLLIAQGRAAVQVRGLASMGRPMEGRYLFDVVLRQLDGRWFVQELRSTDQS